MTTDKNQPLFTAEEDFAPNQEGSGRPRGPLRFPMPEGGDLQSAQETKETSLLPNPKVSPPSAPGSEDPRNSEHQLSRKETPSPPAENVELEKEGEGKPDGPLRFPMPEGEGPQSVPGPADRSQSSSRKQPLSGGTSLPWSTWFLGLLGVTILFLCGISLWDTLNGLWKHSAVVGMAGLVLIGLLTLVTTAVAIQEWQAIQRINVLEEIRQQAERSLAPSNDVGDLDLARKVINGLITIYSSREDTRRGSQRLAEKQGDIFAASGLITLAEIEVLKVLDGSAEKVIGDTALRIATETAFIPWPLADVLLVFLSSMQMFRRIAQIYGSRPGVVASWTLSRKVLAQMVVAGALSESGRWVDAVVSHGFLHLTRPIGEGVTNAILLARSGVAAVELCRPLPFHSCQPPSASVFGLIRTALGALGKDDTDT